MRRATDTRDGPVRRLIVPLMMAVATVYTAQAFAQAPFPAPLPGQAEAPASSASPLPHVNGATPLAAPGASAAFPSDGRTDACMKGFAPLREEAEARGRLITAARERRAPADEACKLIASFSQSEVRMIEYLEANSGQCGVSPVVADQVRAGHRNTEKMHERVCAFAQRSPTRRRTPAGPVGDF